MDRQVGLLRQLIRLGRHGWPESCGEGVGFGAPYIILDVVLPDQKPSGDDETVNCLVDADPDLPPEDQ